MIGINEQIELFKLVGAELKRRIECVVIGGSAMLFYGMKSATKDVDLVFSSEDDRRIFSKAIEKIGFEKRKARVEYKIKAKGPVLMERKGARFDPFCNEIISFKMSPGIMERVKEKHEFGNLIADIVSLEDIILLKSATDRAGDRKDVFELVGRFPVNWDIVINESVWQMNHGGKVFAIFLFDFLEELKDDYKAEIPEEAIRKLRKLAAKEMFRALEKRD